MYETRAAVAEANDDDARVGAPGVVYVPSGFRAENAGMAGRTYLWEGYKHPTSDPATKKRLAGIPRSPQLDVMNQLFIQLWTAELAGGGALVAKEPTAEAVALNATISGPRLLKAALRDYADKVTDRNRQRALTELAEEIARIEHGRTASMAHPNTQGAFSWAGLSAERLREHAETSKRVANESSMVPAPGVETLSDLLRRYNMRSTRPLRADAAHLNIDSLMVGITTSARSDAQMVLPAFLVLHLENEGRTRTAGRQLTFPRTALSSPPASSTGER